MITAGGQFRPSPGIDSTPPPPKRPDRRHNALTWMGREHRLPDRCQVRVNARAGMCWVRTGDLVVALTEDGPLRLDDDERRLILEGWDLL